MVLRIFGYECTHSLHSCVMMSALFVKFSSQSKFYLDIDYDKWGSSGFAEQQNLKKICRGIRNSSTFSAEQRNSPPLPDADFLENDKRNAEFS